MLPCPRRSESFSTPGFTPESDRWLADHTCAYCGSLSPEEFLRRAEAGETVTPTDKNYKAYIGNHKFYFPHLTEDQAKKFIELYNSKKMILGHPGHFYVRPYFVAPRV